ncbi:MAG TPA: hypothetical protein QGF05_01885, partial [Dehalococcoidia bacterium]|nr:hypothetical protein [Dehalococcoidia bacterium]
EHAWGREKSVVIVGAGRNGIDGLRAVDPDWPQQAMEMDIVEFVGVETGPPETLPGGGAHLLLRPGANGNLDQIRQYGGLDTPITILSEPVADVDQREDLKALTLQLGASLVYADLPA